MNRSERKILKRIYLIVNSLTNVGPSNPCDIKALAKVPPLVRKVTSHLLIAIDELHYGNYESSEEYLEVAEKELLK